MFVAAQGGAYSQFKRALERRNFLLAWTLANELPRLPRDEAFALLLLARDCDQGRYVLAAPRWHARLCSEEALDLDESQIALAALNGLRDARRLIAAQVLTGLFKIHGFDRELAVLERWLAHPKPP